jgi:hypothetical protein
VAAGLHKDLDSMILLEYAKVILKEGELPSMDIKI